MKVSDPIITSLLSAIRTADMDSRLLSFRVEAPPQNSIPEVAVSLVISFNELGDMEEFLSEVSKFTPRNMSLVTSQKR